MRIAQVTSSLASPLGGAEQYCVELATWLAGEGHEVVLIGHGAPDDLRDRVEKAGVTVIDARVRRPYPPGARSGSALSKAMFHGMDVLESLWHSGASRMIRSGRFDIVHVHRWPGYGTSVMQHHRVLAPTVHTVHDFALVDTTTTTTRHGRFVSRLPVGQRLRARLLARAAPRIGSAIFPTERTLARHRELGFRMPAGAAWTIPHGWRLPPSRSRSRRAGGLFQVLYMGKLVDEKGVRMLLDAWGDGIPGAVLRFAGAGTLEPLIRQRARTAGVEFLGWLDKEEQSEALSVSDVLVLPSLWPENFPLVVAESLIAGVPVLATTTSAPEILEDGKNAAIVSPTSQSLRRELVELVNDRDRARRLAAGAAASAAQLDFDTHAERVLQVYTAAINRFA